MIDPGEIAPRLAAVQARITAACARAGRDPATVTLVAVSKTKPAELVRAAAGAGQRVFGENYVQELLAKKDSLADLDLRWHFVGTLQKNKAKDVVGRVTLIHTVDDLRLAETLDRRHPGASAAGGEPVPQDVLIEVNLAGEGSKGGVAPGDVPALVDGIRGLPRLRCRGLMAIPPPGEDNRARFRALCALARSLDLPELSMGMSDDFEVAIEEGATLVRVGTAIFGARG